MTVIVALRSKSDQSYAFVCDCLLTSDSQQQFDIELPFRTIGSSADFTTYGLTRKCYFPHPRLMLLWAGRQLVAKILARYLASQVDRLLRDTEGFSFQGVIAECLSQEDALQCCFVLARIIPLENDVTRLRYHAFNCEKAEDNNFDFFGAGSGFEIATTGMWLGPDEHSEHSSSELVAALPQAIQMVSRMLSNEHFTDTYRYFRAGGWYEIIVPTASGFLPVSYAINTFVKFNDSWDLIWRFSSFYSEAKLMAIRASFDLLADLSVDPSYQIKGTEFKFFPVIELYMDDPSPRHVKLTLQHIFGKGAQFSLNVFIDQSEKEASINFVSDCDALAFGEDGSEIRFDMDSLTKILAAN